MDVLKERYTITELSQYLNVTDHALRYYEKEFNMDVPKDKRGRRYYTPDLANVMYQIKKMRDEGLEIKAIRKILISENIINDPYTVAPVPASTPTVSPRTGPDANEIIQFFTNFKEELTTSISTEVCSAKEYISNEINKSKLELGACVENSARKLESKMEKHFNEVDRSISNWRERNKSSVVKRFMHKVFKPKQKVQL